MVQRDKGRKIVDRYYDEIYKKRNVKKLSENFPKALEIHNRLLNRPVKERKLRFIHKYQIADEMTQEEQDLLLATYEGGKFTLKDWLETVCRFSPPSRPKMESPKDIESLLDRALKLPIYVVEAKSQGFDRDENLIKQIRDYEDRVLLGEVRRLKTANVNEPTIEEMVTYFQNNKEEFGVPKTMEIDVIWCQDLDTAQKVKEEIDNGKDFESAKQEYALNKKMKAFTTRPFNEGLFWDKLWAAEPNDILGPVKGYDGRDIKWRIVKILEKKPGEIQEYTEKMNDNIKRRMMDLRRKEILDKYGEEVLKKNPYQIYEDRIKDIDPWDIP
jgi:peptidyl-prolyl cis-trans isomerase C